MTWGALGRTSPLASISTWIENHVRYRTNGPASRIFSRFEKLDLMFVGSIPRRGVVRHRTDRST